MEPIRGSYLEHGSSYPLGLSLDPLAGGKYANKAIWTVEQIAENLNRTGWDWYTNNYGELDDGILNFGFWLNQEELSNSYYVSATGTDAFSEANPETFNPFTTAQKVVASEAIGLWDDLIGISFRETKSFNADIAYGNTDTGGAQAYAYLPFGNIYDSYYEEFDFDEIGRISGDVWIDGFVSSNFTPLQDSYYSVLTMIHETGHALGLSHPGDYDALDDDDGDGEPDPITYQADAFFAQDSLQYSVMSYFDSYETGAQHIDWSLMNFAYAATPLVHDIAAIQEIYGADTTTRTGDTVYGFNSNANRDAYDFGKNPRPIVTIWDAGGNDTLDFSGWNTPSTIDLNEGAFSSGGGIEKFLTLEQVNANRAVLNFAPRTAEAAAFYESIKAAYGITSPLFKDNISIAYGVVIENAIGGGGNDRIIGNQTNNVLTGNAGADTFIFKTLGHTGADRITDFGRTDALVTQTAIADRNADGLVTWSKNHALELDSTDKDQVTLDGASFSNGLRYLGSSAGEYFYADARVRPVAGSGHTVREGSVSNDLLNGSGSSSTRTVLFFDVAGAAATGNDTISGFSKRDILVTTVKLADGNGDNLINLGADGLLQLGENEGTINFNANLKLEFDGLVSKSGTDYFVYSLAGSTAGIGDLIVA
ncbi:M10 family metallopeptidase [Novosphingobium sp. 9U]|uniref:M10 family metallopeptidase n=1 Tax=Novosphingobium sp. 9U TaxID=2653158 RepID=UPI0012F0183A|nr:M10 family metallopeptidase [Novosphingobium sp. 9U]VWX51020.1 putative Serralysin [Novosphingobium sp. 9U]